MVDLLEHHAEHNGEVVPAYTGENAPYFKYPEDFGHIALLEAIDPDDIINIDLIDTDEYEAAVEADEQAAKERAEQAEREKLGLTDEAFWKEWNETNKINAEAAIAEQKRRKGTPGKRLSRKQQIQNARAEERAHAARVPKNVRKNNQGPRVRYKSGTASRRAQQLSLIR